MKKVSVIVPVYNASKYLEECLNSLVNQTLGDIEIIVVNDGSKDKSLDILKKYLKKYPSKIVLIDNEQNLGIGKTRNKALKIATGEYIGFMDSDDYADLEMYEEYYNFAKENKLDIVNSYYKKVFDNKTIEFGRNPHKITNLDKNKNLINEIEYGPWSKIYLRKNITKNKLLFDEKLKYEDMPFVLKNYYHAKRIGYLDKPLYNYRIHGSSETTTMDKRVFDMFEILEDVNNYYSNKKMNEELEYLNIRQITRYMLQQKHQKDKKLKKSFIDTGYQLLNGQFPNWKNNNYYKKESFVKRMIQNNKILLKVYCKLGR